MGRNLRIQVLFFLFIESPNYGTQLNHKDHPQNTFLPKVFAPQSAQLWLATCSLPCRRTRIRGVTHIPRLRPTEAVHGTVGALRRRRSTCGVVERQSVRAVGSLAVRPSRRACTGTSTRSGGGRSSVSSILGKDVGRTGLKVRRRGAG